MKGRPGDGWRFYAPSARIWAALRSLFEGHLDILEHNLGTLGTILTPWEPCEAFRDDQEHPTGHLGVQSFRFGVVMNPSWDTLWGKFDDFDWLWKTR